MFFSLVARVATGDVNRRGTVVLSAVPAQVRVFARRTYVPGPTPSDHVVRLCVHEPSGRAGRLPPEMPKSQERPGRRERRVTGRGLLTK